LKEVLQQRNSLGGAERMLDDYPLSAASNLADSCGRCTIE
jgi:hypothetical protein